MASPRAGAIGAAIGSAGHDCIGAVRSRRARGAVQDEQRCHAADTTARRAALRSCAPRMNLIRKAQSQSDGCRSRYRTLERDVPDQDPNAPKAGSGRAARRLLPLRSARRMADRRRIQMMLAKGR
jgi:hypothetical protein